MGHDLDRGNIARRCPNRNHRQTKRQISWGLGSFRAEPADHSSADHLDDAEQKG